MMIMMMKTKMIMMIKVMMIMMMLITMITIRSMWGRLLLLSCDQEP